MPNRKSYRLLIYAIFAVIYVLCALYALSYFFSNSSLGDQYPRTRFDAMVDGYAAKPFIYRQLVPILVRAVDEVTHPDFRNQANGWMEKVKNDRSYEEFRRYTPWLGNSFPYPPTHYKRLVASLWLFGFWAGYMLFMFLLARTVFPDEPSIALFAPIFATLAFGSFGAPWQYIYDIPTLCLSAACFYCMATQRFRAYLFCFFLSVLNKETAFFTLVFFTLWFWPRLETRKFAFLWSLQCLIYLLVKLSVSLYFVNNEGFFLEPNLPKVLADDVLAEANIHKFLFIAMIWWLLAYRWKEKPIFLKTSLALVPMIYIAYLFHGYPHEYRVFFDLHAPLILLATHTLIVGTGIHQARWLSNQQRVSGHAHASLS